MVAPGERVFRSLTGRPGNWLRAPIGREGSKSPALKGPGQDWLSGATQWRLMRNASEAKVAEHHHRPKITTYDAPAGGWGSVKSLARSLGARARSGERQHRADAAEQARRLRLRQLRLGQARPSRTRSSSARTAPRQPPGRSPRKRAPPEFFAAHTLTELEAWTDHDLEDEGRLDRSRCAGTRRATAIVAGHVGRGLRATSARELKALSPEVGGVLHLRPRLARDLLHVAAVRAAVRQQQSAGQLEHVPREHVGGACRRRIGVPVGTVTLDDFEQTDCIFFFGQNVGTNSPRMLHQLQDARAARRADHHLQSAARARPGRASSIRSRRARC